MGFFKKKHPTVYPTHIIVGLGNPGAAYRGTRHNVGFDVIDLLAKRHKIAVTTSKHQALTGVGMICGVPVLLVKPLTFMNLSGRSVKPLMAGHNLLVDHLIVIADDLDLETGRVRMKPKGSAGGHNGHKSLIQSLGSEDYARIKIGIGKAGETIDHVLSRFKPDERVLIDDAVAKSADGVEIWLSDGLEIAMNRINP